MLYNIAILNILLMEQIKQCLAQDVIAFRMHAGVEYYWAHNPLTSASHTNSGHTHK